MKYTYDTTYGEVEFSSAVFDIDGTNLVEGTEVRLDGELVVEDKGTPVSTFDEMTTDEVEEYLLKNGI